MNRYVPLLVLVVGLCSLGDAAQTAPPARVKLLLPHKSSQVLVGKTKLATGKGKTREITLPDSVSSLKTVEMTVVWEPNNYTRFIRTVHFAPVPGSTVTVDARKASPKVPDRIEVRYVPTPEDVVDRMCKLASIGKDDVVYDLGCGDGRMVLRAVTEFKARQGVGIDLDPERITDCQKNARLAGSPKNVEFRVGDVLNIKDLSNASVVLLYMGDDLNLRLRPILQKTLKPGARIVSHRFKMGDWKPDKTEEFKGADGDDYEIHLWVIKKE